MQNKSFQQNAFQGFQVVATAFQTSGFQRRSMAFQIEESDALGFQKCAFQSPGFLADPCTSLKQGMGWDVRRKRINADDEFVIRTVLKCFSQIQGNLYGR